MARRSKKVVKKTVKANAKRKVAKTNVINFNSLEQEVIQAPLIIAAKVTKHLEAYKKKEVKLKKVIIKAKSDLVKTDAKLKIFSKADKTAAIKKRLVLMKKKYADQVKEHAQLTKELENTTKEINLLIEQQTKFVALSKNLIQFQKDWKNNVKKTKVVKNAHKKVPKVKKIIKAKKVDEQKHDHHLQDHQHTHKHMQENHIENQKNHDFPFTETLHEEEINKEEMDIIS